MELRHLHYFSAVAQTLNFRRAAEQLHITRPTLSMQIRDLEEELGLQLLERTTARVRLTEAGRVYLREVKQILALVEQAGELARQAAKQDVRRISIGGVGPLTPFFLPSVLRSFHQQFPAIEVEIMDLVRDEHLRAVKSGEAQLAFNVITQLNPEDDQLHYEPIHSLRLAVCLSRSHPLAARPSLQLRDLVDETFIIVDSRYNKSHRNKIHDMFQSENLPLPRMRTTQSYDSLTSFIAADLGVSITIEMLEPHHSNGIRIVPLQHTGSDPHVTLAAIRKKGQPSGILDNFIQLLKEDAAAIPLTTSAGSPSFPANLAPAPASPGKSQVR